MGEIGAIAIFLDSIGLCIWKILWALAIATIVLKMVGLAALSTLKPRNLRETQLQTVTH